MTEAAANAIAAGVKVWVPDADEAWVSATVTSVDGDDAVVQVAGAEAATRTIGVRECNLQEREDREDMVKLNYLHEPGVLHNLGNRYGLDEIYTYTGSILIAARPRGGVARALAVPVFPSNGKVSVSSAFSSPDRSNPLADRPTNASSPPRPRLVSSIPRLTRSSESRTCTTTT